MYKIIVATHGELADGLKNTLGMFSNDTKEVYTVNLTESGVENFRDKVVKLISEIYEDDKQILVLADLFGGTPFNIAVMEIKGKYPNVEIIAGVNLPILIEATLMRDSDLSITVNSLVESGKTSISSVPSMVNSCEDDE